MEEQEKEWFETWFDSPYYHILYKHRDHQEAKLFVDRLIKYLKPNSNSTILDLACGKGRHAMQLSEMDFQVTGLDLSKNSIDHAKQFEKDNLSFGVHDMRKIYKTDEFNYVFSLFTSFGYFNNVSDNIEMLRSVNVQLTNRVYLCLTF